MNAHKFYSLLTVGVIGVAALFFAGKAVSADELKSLQNEAIAPVVQLNRNCSSVVINTNKPSSTYLVTANHCVSDGASQDRWGNSTDKNGMVTVDVKDKAELIETNQYVYDVLIRDTKLDLAVLKLRKEGLMLQGADILTEDPQEGEDVVAVGYPLGLTRTVTRGNFGGFEAMSSDLQWDEFGGPSSDPASSRAMYRATPPIFGGNSGGGMFVERDGHWKLAGISDVNFPRFFVAGYYVPQNYIRDVVERALKNENKDPVTIEQKKSND